MEPPSRSYAAKEDEQMHKGYNLRLPADALSDYFDDGELIRKQTERVVGIAMDNLKDTTGRLIAERVNANWFPGVDANVFISHSHQDSHAAICLAGFLSFQFGLQPFVDFTVWGHGEDLLRMLDDEYCFNKATRTYDYNKRNRSTAHVYMMVSVALCRMIDRCECVLFLNTPSSVVTSNYIGGPATASPWIYSEIAMTGLVQKKPVDEHRKLRKSATAMNEDLRVIYPVELSHLAELGINDLARWKRERGNATGADALDQLYALK